MQVLLWWMTIVALCAQSHAQDDTRTVCDDESCRCDAFTRIICNCTRDYDEVTLRPDGAFRVPSTTRGIIIDGCARVYFLSDTVTNLIGLREIELRNNRHVHFKERSLAWSPFQREYETTSPGLRITIDNCTINEISSHAIRGRVDYITIANSRINMIRPFAFSSLSGVRNIELIDNVYDNIEIQAFKKFTTQNFNFRGGEVKRAIPSRFLSDVQVVNILRLDGVTVNTISSLAFLANSPKTVLIERNHITTLDGDAFHISSSGPVTFRNNTITTMNSGALLGLSVERWVITDVGFQEIIFENNTVTYVTPGSFLFNRSAVTLRVDSLNINVSCHCDLAEIWQDMLSEQSGVISCWYMDAGYFVPISSFMDSHCGTFQENLWIFIVVGVILFIVLGIIIALIIIRKKRQKKRKVQIVLPDGKTYRETEFHIVVERAELLTTDL